MSRVLSREEGRRLELRRQAAAIVDTVIFMERELRGWRLRVFRLVERSMIDVATDLRSRAEAGITVLTPAESIHLERCSLCGKMLPPWGARAWDGEGAHRLCHGDGDPRPTCYERWVMGERPGEAVKG